MPFERQRQMTKQCVLLFHGSYVVLKTFNLRGVWSNGIVLVCKSFFSAEHFQTTELLPEYVTFTFNFGSCIHFCALVELIILVVLSTMLLWAFYSWLLSCCWVLSRNWRWEGTVGWDDSLQTRVMWGDGVIRLSCCWDAFPASAMDKMWSVGMPWSQKRRQNELKYRCECCCLKFYYCTFGEPSVLAH